MNAPIFEYPAYADESPVYAVWSRGWNPVPDPVPVIEPVPVVTLPTPARGLFDAPNAVIIVGTLLAALAIVFLVLVLANPYGSR